MGKKGSWLSAVKKALTTSDSKKNKKSGKKNSKKYWFGRQRSVDKDVSHRETKFTEAENEQSKHAHSVAYATAVAAEAAVAAAHAAAEVVRLTSTAHLLGKSKEETAAIKIQTAYRGHLARRALRALRGLVRLKSLIEGQSVKRQATSTLKCMQTLARVQSQVRSRRIRMSEENKVVQQLLLKHEKDHIRSSLRDTWHDSRKSNEETEASLRRKQEGAVRRERVLAYAHAHQMWKNCAKLTNPTFLDSNNPHWGWSWLERWMAARPWDTQSIPDKESPVCEAGKSVNCQSPSTPPTRTRSSSSRVRPKNQMGSADGDSRSFYSVQSDQNKWCSVTSSVCDDKSVESYPVVPNYMASTESAKARSRMASPIHSPSPLGSGRKGSSEKGSALGSAKKQLSFSSSPARTATRFTSH